MKKAITVGSIMLLMASVLMISQAEASIDCTDPGHAQHCPACVSHEGQECVYADPKTSEGICRKGQCVPRAAQIIFD